MKKIRNIYVLMSLLCGLSVSVQASSEQTSEDNEFVVIERDNTYSYMPGRGAVLSSYLERRQKWGVTVLGSSAQYRPSKIISGNPDISSSTTLSEFEVGFNRHLGKISLGIDFGYANSNLVAKVDTATTHSFAINIYRVGLELALDGWFSEPHVVPFVKYGLYCPDYVLKVKNETTTTVVGDYPGCSNFVSGGLLIRLNEIDSEESLGAYHSLGLENTFLYLAATQYQAVNKKDAPDFSTGADIGTGLRLEF